MLAVRGPLQIKKVAFDNFLPALERLSSPPRTKTAATFYFEYRMARTKINPKQRDKKDFTSTTIGLLNSIDLVVILCPNLDTKQRYHAARHHNVLPLVNFMFSVFILARERVIVVVQLMTLAGSSERGQNPTHFPSHIMFTNCTNCTNCTNVSMRFRPSLLAGSSERGENPTHFSSHIIFTNCTNCTNCTSVSMRFRPLLLAGSTEKNQNPTHFPSHIIFTYCTNIYNCLDENRA